MKLYVSPEQALALWRLDGECRKRYDGPFDEERWLSGVAAIVGEELPRGRYELVVQPGRKFAWRAPDRS
jgi:hypothetical protein